MSALKYRPDIDGLRALAVLAVIFYHAGVPFMAGGFVGVDVFFVISGYLITSLILKDLEQGTFTFAGFWERRFRRILPPLFVMIVVTAIAGFFVLLPDDYLSLGKEIMSQAAFASNILFYKQSGYFDAAASLKPLLHTWSLAVEEQFYLLYPIALYTVWKRWRRHLGLFLILSTVISFALCLLVMTHNKNIAFFMLPFRGWELLVGALTAYYAPRFNSMKADVAESIAALGLFAVILPVYFYSDQTTFPGYSALAPVVGTASLIWANGCFSTGVSRILSLRPVVFVGLVSYSWYLWHWPILVYAKYNPLQPVAQKMVWACIGLSFLLAVLSWRYIETPLRKKIFLPTQQSLYQCVAVVMLFLAGAGLTLFLTKGVPARLDPAVVRYAAGVSDSNPQRYQCDKTHVDKIEKDKVCQALPDSGKAIDFILWGDSQADAIAPLFFNLSQKYGRNGYITTHHGCEAVTGFHKSTWDGGFDCNEYNEAIFNLIRRHNIKNVFLVSAYNGWMSANYLHPEQVVLDGPYPEGYKTILAAGFARLLDRLEGIGAHVYILIDVPLAPFDPPRVLAMDRFFNPAAPVKTGTAVKSYMFSRQAQIEPFLDKYGRHKVTVLDPAPLLCTDDNCKLEEDGYPLYYNSNHVSTHGALFLAPLFDPYFKKGF